MVKRKMTTTKLPELMQRMKRGRAYAYARFNGREVQFGPVDDPQTRVKFDAHLAQWLSRDRKPEATPVEGALSVRSMVARYLGHLKADEDDAWWNSTYATTVRRSLDELVRLHGHEKANDFGGKKLKGVRASLASATRRANAKELRDANERDGCPDRTELLVPMRCLKTIREQMRCLRNAFEWALSEEIVTPDKTAGVPAAVKVVNKIKRGRGSRKVPPVDRETVDATLEHVGSAAVRAAIELMWWCGARPAEVLNLTPGMIDRSGDVWTADLVEHKNAHRGLPRRLCFGPRSQEALRPFLLRPADKPLFSPIEAEESRRRRMRDARDAGDTHPSVNKTRDAERKANPQRVLGDRYSPTTFRLAIQRAVKSTNRARENAGLDPIEMWYPYRLRHSAATRIRKEHGIEVARVLLGHTTVDTTAIYAEADMQAALVVAGQIA